MFGSVRQLLLLALLQPLSWSMAHAEQTRILMQDEPEAEYSCEDIEKVPVQLRCSFVMANCEAESRVPYTQWYYCSVAPYGVLAKAMFVLLLLILLPLLFSALGDTAELYFSPTMAIVAQTIPGMRPRFAGVTFVAVGNGAPDLSANISALRTGQVALSAGAITGAAMFVQCVVASEVIRISGGVHCRGATLRDVGVYAVCTAGVGLALHSGKVTRWFVAGCSLAYLAYALWVFAGDEWHARGRPELRPGLGMSWKELRTVLLERQHRRRHGTSSVTTGSPPTIPSYSGLPIAADDNSNTGLTEALLPWATIEDTVPPANNHNQQQPTTATNKPAAPLFPVEEGADDGRSGGSVMTLWPPGAVSVETESVTATPGGVTVTGQRLETSASHVSPDPQRWHPTPFAETHGSVVWHSPATSPTPAGARSGGVGPAGAEEGLRREHAGVRSRASAARAGASNGARGSGVLGARMYRQAVWADLAYEPGSRGRRQLAVELGANGHIQPWRAASLPLTRDAQGHGLLPILAPSPLPSSQPSPRQSPHRSPQGGVRRDLEPGRAWDGLGLPGGDRPETHPHPLLLTGGLTSPGGRTGVESPDGVAPAKLLSGDWWQQLWQSVCDELTFGSSQEWSSFPAWRRRLRTASFALLLPVYAALRLSVPMADPETYNQQWLVASMLCCPLAVIGYFGWLSLSAVLCAMAAGVVLASLMHVITKDEMELPALDCGTRFSFGPALVSLVGFFIGVLWIDSFASEVVGVIGLLSGLLRLPPSLVGLTLLTWGNSLGDFFGNQAMARRGASSTALTACFAAPLFNMLLSMAIGFSTYFAKEKVTSAIVSLPPDAAIGIVALISYNIILAAVGLANNYYLPPRFYLFARVWYGVYLVAAAVLALTSTSEV